MRCWRHGAALIVCSTARWFGTSDVNVISWHGFYRREGLGAIAGAQAFSEEFTARIVRAGSMAR